MSPKKPAKKPPKKASAKKQSPNFDFHDEIGLPVVSKYIRNFLKDCRTTFPEVGHGGQDFEIEIGHMGKNSKREHRGFVQFQRRKPLDPDKPLFRMIIRINKGNRYPLDYKTAIDTKTLPAPEGKRAWKYILADVTWDDVEEHIAFIFGHEMWHFLKLSKQAKGRNSEPAANRFGLRTLEDFRVWRRCQDDA